MIKKFEKFDIENIKGLASDTEIKVIDHKFINKLALFAINNLKKMGNFSIIDPYKYFKESFEIFKGVKRIQFVVDKSIIKEQDAYMQPYNKNGKYYMFQIVSSSLDLKLFHHEIQHMIYDLQYGEYELVEEAHEVSVLMAYISNKKELEASDIGHFLHDIYVTFPNEVESYLSEIYQELLRKKTTQSSFKEKLKGIEAYDDFLDITDTPVREDYYLVKLRESPKFRVDFFSRLNYFLENSEDFSKLRYKSDFLNKLFSKVKLVKKEEFRKLKYDVKISQKEANEMSKFWINHFKKRSRNIMIRIENMKYLFRPE